MTPVKPVKLNMGRFMYCKGSPGAALANLNCERVYKLAKRTDFNPTPHNYRQATAPAADGVPSMRSKSVQGWMRRRSPGRENPHSSRRQTRRIPSQGAMMLRVEGAQECSVGRCEWLGIVLALHLLMSSRRRRSMPRRVHNPNGDDPPCARVRGNLR